MVPVDVVIAAATALPGAAAVIAVCRAKREDLPAIIRALMRMEPRGDDSRKDPPSLPKP